MIGKPYAFKRRCFQCGHAHESRFTCDEDRRLRAARIIVDLGIVVCGAVMILGALSLLEVL